MSHEPNEMMLELFRSEVESHSESLTSSLLALEQDPAATATLERMMRAAHSIKGAARIVRVDLAADVAHVMEDCFVAAQKGQLAITPDDVDVLLKGVDLLVRISAATRDPQTDWNSLQPAVADAVVALREVLAGGRKSAAPAPSPNRPTVTPSPARPASPTTIACPGFLDGEAAEQARRELVSAFDAGVDTIDLQLGETIDLDDQGLAFLAAARDYARERSRGLRFHPVSDELRLVLQLTGLDSPAQEGVPQ